MYGTQAPAARATDAAEDREAVNEYQQQLHHAIKTLSETFKLPVVLTASQAYYRNLLTIYTAIVLCVVCSHSPYFIHMALNAA
jgi:hypothetical protein